MSQVRAAGRTLDLPVGSLLALDPGLPHDVQALEESVPLLTIAGPVHRPKDVSCGLSAWFWKLTRCCGETGCEQ